MCCEKATETPRRQLCPYPLPAACHTITCRSPHVPGASVVTGKGGGGVGSSSASGRGAAEGSEARVATGGMGVASADRGREGKGGGGGAGGEKAGEALSCVKGNSTEKGPGSSFSLSSSGKISGGAPSGKVRLLGIAWIDNMRATTYGSWQGLPSIYHAHGVPPFCSFCFRRRCTTRRYSTVLRPYARATCLW